MLVPRMKIEYVLYASFADYMPQKTGGKPCLLEVAEGTTVGMLVERLRLPESSTKMIFVNGLRVKEDSLLKEGDRAGIFPLVAGG